jgi:hypothetical protein
MPITGIALRFLPFYRRAEIEVPVSLLVEKEAKSTRYNKMGWEQRGQSDASILTQDSSSRIRYL